MFGVRARGVLLNVCVCVLNVALLLRVRGWCCAAVASGRQQSSHRQTQRGEHTHNSGGFVCVEHVGCV